MIEPVNYIALLLENIDTLGSEFTTATYGVLATSLSPILYSFFILYLIFWGFQYWQGYGESNVSSFVFRLFRIAIIFSMATSWGVIQTFAYDVIRQAPSQITGVLLSNIVNSGQGAMSAGTIERDLYDFYRFGYRALDEKPEQNKPQSAAPQTPAAPTPSGALTSSTDAQAAPAGSVQVIAAPPLSGKQILNIAIYVFTTLFIGSALAIVIFAKLTLWLCLSLAPVFIALLMFKAPSKYFAGWLNILIQSVIIPIFLYAFLAFYFIGIKDIVIAFAVMLNKPETYSFEVASPIALVSLCGFLLIIKIIPMISQIASNTQSVTLSAASAKLINMGRSAARGGAFGGAGGGTGSATSSALNASGGTTYGNPRDHATLDAQERQAAARRQRRNL